MNCQNCLKQKASKICSKCNDGYYCSKECQRDHWILHKIKCTDKTQEIIKVNGSKVIQTSFEKEHLVKDKLLWEPCLMIHRLGIPLYVSFIKFECDLTDNSRKLGAFLILCPNSGLMSPTHTHFLANNSGNLIFKRFDDVNFTVQLFFDLYSYVYSIIHYYSSDEKNWLINNKLNKLNFEIYQAEEHKTQLNYIIWCRLNFNLKTKIKGEKDLSIDLNESKKMNFNILDQAFFRNVPG